MITPELIIKKKNAESAGFSYLRSNEWQAYLLSWI